MRGLWVKDLLVLKRQQIAGLLTVVLAICSLVFFGQTGIMIGMTIFSVILSFIALNSLTFDQQNHGLMYLLTMPFEKKHYVIQKYLLLLFTTVGSIIVMTLIAGIFSGIADWDLTFSEVFTRVYGVGAAFFIVIILATHYQIKNGPEKAQVAMSMLGAIVAVVVGGVAALVKYTELGNSMFNTIYTYYLDYGSFPFLVLFTIAAAVVITISCMKSIKTLEHMEIQ